MADNQIPEVQASSYENLLGDMINTYLQKTGLNDLRVGSVSLSLLETVALAVARSTGDIFQIERDLSVDRATGEALQRIAADENLTPIPAQAASGVVNFFDTSFTKVSAKIYAGTVAPVVGSTTINISTDEGFPSSGSVIIGRGTSNVETIAYSSIVPSGSFFVMTLSAPTTQYHNINETVILSQGGVRSIPVNTTVSIPASGVNPEIVFTTTQAATILDGETEVLNVPVVASETGSSGNAIINSITNLPSPPFSGAAVNNTQPFTSGRDQETDDQLRVRIKRKRLSTGLGTPNVIKGSVIGATAPDENKTITDSALSNNQNNDTILYVDDGSGYESLTYGVGVEPIIDSAYGGETNFQLQTGGNQANVSKAFLISTNTAPFNIVGGDKLAISVGGETTEHTFDASDFVSPSTATAYEIVASINGNPTLDWEASTQGSGSLVKIQAKLNTNEDVQVTAVSFGTDAAEQLQFGSAKAETLRLFKNKVLLTKDGNLARIETRSQSQWSPLITTGDNLIIKVDNTSFATYTFTDADFIAEGTFPSVSYSNSLSSWANVINAKVTGITASVDGDVLVLTSNKGRDSNASIEIDPSSTLVSKSMFDPTNLSSFGKTSDYQFSPNTAQIRLNDPLIAGDSLSAGLLETQARLASGIFNSNSITIAANDTCYFWAIADDDTYIKRNLAFTSGSTITVSLSSNDVTYTSSDANAFAFCQVGDYAIIYDTVSGSIGGDPLSPTGVENRIEGRIKAKTNNSITIEVTALEAANITPETVLNNGGFEVFYSKTPPQKFYIPAGTYTLPQAANYLSGQSSQIIFYTEDGNKIIAQTNTRSEDGSLVIAAATDVALTLQLPIREIARSNSSQIAYHKSGYTESQFPSFINQIITADSVGNPYDQTIAFPLPDAGMALTGVDPNKTIVSLQPYSGIEDCWQNLESVEIIKINPTDVTVKADAFYKRLRQNLDRIYLAEPLMIAANDNINVILNKDASNQLYSFNLFRNLVTQSTFGVNTTQFDALDQDNAGGNPFQDFFPEADFFQNFAILMQAKKSVKGDAADETTLLIRSKEWGRSGEYIKYGYFYPSAPNQALNTITSQDEFLKVNIILASGAARTPSIAADTEWDVSVSGNDVTFTWNSVGTDPTSALASVQTGDFVNISSSTGFSAGNQGVFRVDSTTATSFTVKNPNGVNELNIPTGLIQGILFYEYLSTTALDVNDFINNGSLNKVISSTIVDDNGTSGAGEITVSTFEYSSFTDEYENLLDGINWIEIYDPASSPNFTLKNPLQLASDIGYEFQDGEVCRLVPTTIAQMSRFLNIPAVSALSLAGEIDIVLKDGKLQFSTNSVGSSGAIQVVGGPGNTVTLPVVGSAFEIYTPDTSSYESLALANANKANLFGLISDQWVKVSAATTQTKETEFNSAGTVTITPNSPSAGKSLISVSGKSIGQRYFGNPRNFVFSEGRTYKVEKQGLFTCISWDKQGSSPNFEDTLDLALSTPSFTITPQTNSAEIQITGGSGTFVAVDIGDDITISGSTNNNGTFRVLGVSNNNQTILYQTDNAVSETGSFTVSAVGKVREGDTVMIGSPFNILNQGKFRVIRQNDDAIWIDNPATIEEIVTDSTSAVTVGYNNLTQFAVSATNNVMVLSIASGSGSFSSVKVGDEVTILPSSFSAGNQGTFKVKAVSSTGTAITLTNPNAVVQASVTGILAGQLAIHRPAINFWDYEATVEGDSLFITSDFLGASNQDQWIVSEVVSDSQIVIDEIMASASSVLGSDQPNFLIQEQNAYVGYKKIRQKYEDPNSNTNGIIVFDTSDQYTKINSQAQVTLSPMNKLEFSTQVAVGLDAYKYFGGLVGEANRVVYGSPQDSITYPGVAAAGAEIFVREPLIRRVQVGITVKIATGIPFIQIVQQVRQNVASLINSNPIGEPIAISDIVASVNSIFGVTAVAITSPLYNQTNMTININPAEKAKILNPVTDILVSEGS